MTTNLLRPPLRTYARRIAAFVLGLGIATAAPFAARADGPYRGHYYHGHRHGHHGGVVYVAPGFYGPPVVYAPRPVVYPAPYYVAAPPVYVAPAPVAYPVYAGVIHPHVGVSVNLGWIFH